jgi:hypothetical protein
MKPAAGDADVHLAMFQGVVDEQRTVLGRWATLPLRGAGADGRASGVPGPAGTGPAGTGPAGGGAGGNRAGGHRAGGRRVRGHRAGGTRVVVAGGLVGCLVVAGCVSVRPLELVPADRVAQTSLVLDAGGADGGGAARAGGPDGGAAGRGEPVDAAGRGRHRPRPGRQAPRGPGPPLGQPPGLPTPPPPPPSRGPAAAGRAGYPAFFPRTVSSTACARWSTTRVKSCWA